MIRAEQKILQDLNYNLPRPTRSYFLERFLLVSRVDCLDLESRRNSKLSTAHLPSPFNLRNYCECPSPSPGSGLYEDEISIINSLLTTATTTTSTSSITSSLSSTSSSSTSPSSLLLSTTTPLLQSIDSSSSFMSTPIKPSSLQRNNSIISNYEESDLTSNESQSVQSPSSRQILYTYTPLHGYVPSNERFKREESFAKMLLYVTLQVIS